MSIVTVNFAMVNTCKSEGLIGNELLSISGLWAY